MAKVNNNNSDLVQNREGVKTPPCSPTGPGMGIPWVNFTPPFPPLSPKSAVVSLPMPEPEVLPANEKYSLRHIFWQNRGIFLAILSSFTFSVTAVLVKRLKDYDHANIALWRFVGVILPSIPLVVKRSREEYLRRQSLPDKIKAEERVWWSARSFSLLTLRSILSCNAVLLHFWALDYISAADAIVVFQCSPIFAYTLGYLHLGEPCGLIPMATSIASLVGVVIIQRPPFLTGHVFDKQMMIGTVITLACALLSVISFITLRKSRYVPYSITTMAYGLWGTFENTIIVLAMGTFALPRTMEDWFIGGVLAALAFLGQVAIVLALKVEQAGPVSLIRTFDVIFGFLFQSLLMHSTPDIYNFIGAGIITVGIVLTGLRKWLMTLPPDDGIRKAFWILLK